MIEPTTLTLPGPTVTRAVTWDAVRAYLRAEGWERSQDDGLERWFHPRGLETVWTGDVQRMDNAVVWIANHASVSPGEMLARIADNYRDSRLMPWRDSTSASGDPWHILDYACGQCAAQVDNDGRWHAFAYGTAYIIGEGGPAKVGEAMAAAEAALARVRP